jgi:hypothetical protein
MQFVKNGPDIPETLLQAHEDGRVVFFCGAGISYPAGLPGFGGFVDRLYRELGETPDRVQAAALKAFQYDTAVGLLETSIGSRETVRRAMVNILLPDLTAKDATTTHEALLTLSKTKGGATRLITTNFDRLFQHVIDRDALSVNHFAAPLLPVPKSRWDGLVYIHGLLAEIPTPPALDQLVISSGDFGLAYLTERWAARFVSELFRNYVVCFVGYSLNDPVLRYMTDALAADRLRGEASPEMFAFGSYKRNKEEQISDEWRAKNVVPILYKESAGHPNLHKTIRSWAKTYRDGVRGKERIVVDCALAGPLSSTRQDDFVGRMLWAISDLRGSAAKQFAEHAPAPTLDWLQHFCEERYGHQDLPRFGVEPERKSNSRLKFSLIRRPSPYSLAPLMAIVHGGETRGQMDEVMSYIAQWLTRHLDDPALVLWLATRGGQLGESFAWMVERKLEEAATLEQGENAEEINRFKARSPNGIPRVAMRTLWRLLLAGRIKSISHNFDIYRWIAQFHRDGLTASLRLRLRDLLAPRVALRKSLRSMHDSFDPGQEEPLKQLVDWDVVLAVDHARSSLSDIIGTPQWHMTLPSVLDDVHGALRDTLDLMRELGEADDRSDLGMWHMSSIAPHWQNRGFHDWTVLIELVRDAWSATFEADHARGRRAVHAFLGERYPTFVRLALHAATRDGATEADEWVDWLVTDNGWWLWSVETQREVMRLLVLRGAQLPREAQTRVENCILAGPPRIMYKEDIEDQRWPQIVDHTVWLRLAKLREGGVVLTGNAQQRLQGLEFENPQWGLSGNEREEFSHWMSGTGDPDYKFERQLERVPQERKLLEEWLQKEPSNGLFREDDWGEVCRDRFSIACGALLALGRRGIWPKQRWREALQVWSGGALLQRSWRYLAPTVNRMPLALLQEIAQSATWWLEEIGKGLKAHEAEFFNICERFLSVTEDEVVNDDDPISRAINHPKGHVTQALLHWWFSTKPEDDQLLPRRLSPIFSRLCDTSTADYRHARVLLCSNVIALMRVDPSWANVNILPLFDWQKSKVEARAAWMGYLWAPRLYRPLLTAFKPAFLATAKRYADLGDHARQYASVLTFAALDPADVFGRTEIQAAIRVLPQDGLEHCARALVQALGSAGDQRAEYWSNRVQPFIEKIWPKTTIAAPKLITEQFARLALAAGESFPYALAVLKPWLVPIEYPYAVVSDLAQYGTCDRFPREALNLIDLIIGRGVWPTPELAKCVETIAKAAPELVGTDVFQRVEDHVNRPH